MAKNKKNMQHQDNLDVDDIKFLMSKLKITNTIKDILEDEKKLLQRELLDAMDLIMN